MVFNDRMGGTWLVTGGAGYIGSHVVAQLVAAGLEPVVLDDLSSGFRRFVPDGVPLVPASILSTEEVWRALVRYDCRGIVHIAGYKHAGESVHRPLHTHEQNVTGTASLLAAATRAGVQAVVFSSSAAVYGTPDVDLVTEDQPTRPANPYGTSKLLGEWLLRDVSAATGLRHTSLRYFNVVGSAAPHLFDASRESLFGRSLALLRAGGRPTIFGTDYPTPDGTCIRDFIHVGDLARAHVAAVQRLAGGEPVQPVYNLGSGTGTSVRQIMAVLADVSGLPFDPVHQPRRPGDPVRVVACGDLAARDLDWQMRHTVTDMVASAWLAG